MHQRLLASCAVVLLVAFAPADVSTQGPTYTFTTIEVPGAMRTIPVGINDRGEIVGEFVDASGVGHGFLRSNGTFTVIDGPPGSTSFRVIAINNRGEILGETSTTDSTGLYRKWTFVLSGGQFTLLDVPAYPYDINDLGQIAGLGGHLKTGHRSTVQNRPPRAWRPRPSVVNRLWSAGLRFFSPSAARVLAV